MLNGTEKGVALLLEVESETLVTIGIKVPVEAVVGGADEDGA